MHSRQSFARHLYHLLLSALIVVVVSLFGTLSARTASAASPHVDMMTLNSEINPASLSFLKFDSFYAFLHDPNVIFLLFIIAMIGIYLEISHPGIILPGVVGGIAFVLFLFGVSSLTPNWAGFALMVLAFVLLVMDLRLPAHGVLTVGAMISLVFGALLFFNSGGPYKGPMVNPVVVYCMAAVVGLISFALITLVVRVQRRPVTTGTEGMIGTKAVALTPLRPEGRVSYGGEDWAAFLDDPTASVDEGCEVQVISVEELRLRVQPVRYHYPVLDIDSHSTTSLE